MAEGPSPTCRATKPLSGDQLASSQQVSIFSEFSWALKKFTCGLVRSKQSSLKTHFALPVDYQPMLSSQQMRLP